MKNKKMLSLTIVSISIFQMCMVALAPIISVLGEAFPEASQLAAQMANTFLCLIMVIFALLSNSILGAIGRRKAVIIAMVLLIVGALGGALVHSKLWMVYFWSALVGASVGLFVPAVFSLMMDVYDEQTRTGITSIQSMMVGLGGMALSILTGLLAAIHWSRAYLVFLIAIIPLILSIVNMPSEKVIFESLPAGKRPASETATAGFKDVPGFVWLAALQTFVFAILYFTFSTNIALYLVEKGYTSTTLTGNITSLFMFGTCVSSLLLKFVMPLFKRFVPAFSLGLLAASYLVFYFSSSLPLLFIAAFVGGSTLGFMFPYFVVTVGARVDASLSIISSSLIISVAPNLGSFFSPVVITPLTNLLGSANVAPRFLLSAVLAIVVALIQIVTGRPKQKAIPEN